MKEINVNSHNVPATARSKNYRTAQANTASSGGGGGATSPSAAPTTGGASDTAKVAQNLAADSADWAKILRKDIDERTENSLSIGKDITVDGKAILNDVVANTGTFAGLLKAASATITGALTAATVSATTMNASTFIGDLQGNAATATKWKTPISVWGQNIDGSGNVDGSLTIHANGSQYYKFIRNSNGTDEHSGLLINASDDTPRAWALYNGNIRDGYLEIGTSFSNIAINPAACVGINTTSPAYRLDVNGNMRVTSDLYADASVGTRNFASHTSGWQINAQGAADFRSIYADEMRVQAFTADISQALAGSDYLTKSVSKLSANFVVPSSGGSVRIIVDDIEGMPATQCFSNGDYIRFRAFNRTSGLTIANVWGTVTLDTSFGSNGFLNGTQAYTFTCTATSGAGLTVFKGSEVLDYGTSGSGLISRTTLDAMGSPYEQIATWQGDPSNSANYTVHARLGNLNGIANCNGYGLYTDNGFFTGKITVGDLTKSNHYLDFSSGKLTVQGDIRLASGASSVGADGVVSAINMSQEGIKIAASKVDIQGAVTFSSFDSSTQATINGKKDIIYNRVLGNGVGNGAFLIATFTINSAYIDRTIKLSAHDRGSNTPSNVYIKFMNSDDNDPALESFKKDGAIQFYISKSAARTWNLYTNQSQGIWSDIYVTDFYNPQEGSISTTWRTDNVSLPAGYITAGQMIGTAEWCYNNDISYINGAHVYTGTLDAVSIVAGSITGDRIAGNTITGDKIEANTITASQINASSVSAAIASVISLDASRITSGTISSDIIDANTIITRALTSNTITANNATITNLKMTNATISGTLNGVSGTFNYLQAAGSTGRLLFGTLGMTFNGEDISQQGTKNSRKLRYYSNNIRCRGSFGASSLNMARVHDTYIDYYVNGDTDSYVRFNLQSNGVGGYYIPLYPNSGTGYSLSYGNASSGDVDGFPVDLLIFNNSGTYQYEMLPGSVGKKVIAVNANNNNTVYLAINGELNNWTLEGGIAHTFINIREFMTPSVSSSVHGAGWLSCGGHDNDWKEIIN